MPRRFFYLLFAGWLVAFIALHWGIVQGGSDSSTGLAVWIKFYREGMRAPIFTGFLTLGSFLLTLQATLIMRIKEVYDSPEYEEDWKVYEHQLAASGTPVPPYYRPLRHLGIALLTNVLLSILTCISQMTFGFSSAPWAVAFCMSIAAATMFCLLFLWLKISQNLVRWFSVIEKKRESEQKKAVK